MELLSKNIQQIRILIVYSTEMNRLTYKDMFHDRDDCIITYTHLVQRALSLFTWHAGQGFPFDIVFLDYQLPTSNGITLARKFKAVYPKVKLWFFESSHLKEEKIKIAYIEFFGFFREPIATYDQIMEIIERAKAKKQQAIKLRIQANEKK